MLLGSMKNEIERELTTALWIPGWYALDQPLVTGSFERFLFFREVPFEILARPEILSYLGDQEPNIDLVFYNTLPKQPFFEIRYGRILRIEHAELGFINQIKTNGLDYVVDPVDAKPISVNAEEMPGLTAEDQPKIDNWTMRVVLSDVSEPIDNNE